MRARGSVARRGGGGRGRLWCVTFLILSLSACLDALPGTSLSGSGDGSAEPASEPTPAPPSLAELAGDSWVEEPNDRDHLAVVEGAPARIVSRFDAPGDVDAFLLSAALLTPPVTLEVRPPDDVRPRLRLFDSAGVEVYAVSADRAGQRVGIPVLGPAAEGAAWEMVLDDPSGRSSEHAYTISIYRSALAEVAGEAEPNDTPGLAQALPLAEIVGHLHDAGDRDVFAFAGGSRDALALVVIPDPGVDPDLQLRCEGGVDEEFAEAPAGEPESICGARLGGDSCVVAVSARSLDRELAPTGRYRLAGAVVRGLTEREPNDDPGAAGLATLETVSRGLLSSADDVDVFAWRVIAPIDSEAAQTLEVTPPPGVDVSFDLLDETGGRVSRADAGGVGVAERIEVSLPSGTYRVVLRSERGSSCAAPYEIRLDE